LRPVFHLIANGDLVAGAQETGQVCFGGVVRHAAHGNLLAALAVARSERDLQFARRDHCILKEKFVEIAQTE
jgi:hypothetical protein